MNIDVKKYKELFHLSYILINEEGAIVLTTNINGTVPSFYVWRIVKLSATFYHKISRRVF